MKVSKAKAEKWNFPCYGKSGKGTVVFFKEDKIGTCVKEGGITLLGESSNDWCMDYFTPIQDPFEEKVEKEDDFQPITIVLETEEEVVNMLRLMGRSGSDEALENWKKFKAAIKS